MSCQFSALLSNLEKTKTLREVKKLLKNITISDEEKNSCVEGILLTIMEKDPILTLITKFPQYMDAFRFYMKRITTYSNFSIACVYGTKEMIELLMKKNVSRYDLGQGSLAAVNSGRFDIVQFLAEKGIEIPRYGNILTNHIFTQMFLKTNL